MSILIGGILFAFRSTVVIKVTLLIFRCISGIFHFPAFTSSVSRRITLGDMRLLFHVGGTYIFNSWNFFALTASRRIPSSFLCFTYERYFLIFGPRPRQPGNNIRFEEIICTQGKLNIIHTRPPVVMHHMIDQHRQHFCCTGPEAT